MSSASTFSSTWQWLTDVLFTGHRFAHGEIADEEELSGSRGIKSFVANDR